MAPANSTRNGLRIDPISGSNLVQGYGGPAEQFGLLAFGEPLKT